MQHGTSALELERRRPALRERSVTVLGATGSIGASTIDLLKRERDRYPVEAMTAREEPRILSVESELREADRVVISVADTGMGIGSEDIDRIFNPLFTTKSDGMGMGLAICRAIVEAHEGRLWFSPNTPRGAVFQFTVPVHHPAAAAC